MFLSGQAQSLRSVGGSAHLNIEIASFFSKIESLGIFIFLYFMITKWKFLFQEVLNWCSEITVIGLSISNVVNCQIM